jgi:gluconate kinase
MSKILVLMVGPPGSGKSTYSAKPEFRDYIYINQDLQNKKHLEIFSQSIEYGKNVIVDRMNYSKTQRNRYLDVAKAAGYSTHIVVLHECFEVCLERCLKREGHPTINQGDNAIANKAINFFFRSYERVSDDEADIVTRVFPKRTVTFKAVWVDVDNTLSDASHREHFLQVEKKYWKGFFGAMSDDPVNDWCKALVDGMHSSSYKVLICSARPEEYRKQTEDWLDKHGIKYSELIMRPAGDHRKDSIVKEIMYEFEIKTRYNLMFSVDDRKQVIDQIRLHGVVVLDCAGEKGNF